MKETPDASAERTAPSSQKHVREMLYLAEQAKEGRLKVLPGREWGYHYPLQKAEREKMLLDLREGRARPADAAEKLRPDALIYKVLDLETLGLQGVSSRILDESATVEYYDYRRFAEFVAALGDAEVSPAECEKLYEGISKARTQKKLRDAYGTTGQEQMDRVFAHEAAATPARMKTLSRAERVLSVLKLDWLSEERKAASTLERDQAARELSGDERALYEKLSGAYRRYVEEGDEAAYKELVEGLRGSYKTREHAPDTPSESMRKLSEEIEPYKKDVDLPGTPRDPAIPPEDSDEYHTPPPRPESAGRGESVPEEPIFEIEPPLAGYYASGRKSYYDRERKTWSKRKRLAPYAGELTAAKRHTLSGRVTAGLKAIALPNGYALDGGSLTAEGAQPALLRDQNGCFYIESGGAATFTVQFGKEDALFQGPVVSEDTEPLSTGPISEKSEALLAALTGGPRHKAEQARSYILAHHFYPGGGDRAAAQAVQAKLRHESTDADYIQKLDASEYLECYSANTLFIALVRRAGVPARLVVGHKVEGSKGGRSAITTATGHAWAEIWDGGAWVRFDATPPPKPEDKRKEEGEKKEAAPEADDGGEEGTPQGTPPDSSEGKERRTGEAEEGDVKQGEKTLEESQKKLDDATKKREELEEKLERAESFKELDTIKEEAKKDDLLPDMQKDLSEKAEAKEKEMKEAIKDELDRMVDDGFLDSEKRDELERKLSEEASRELDRLQKEIERENKLYNDYERIREEVMPLVEQWFRYFAERLPREESVELDEDALSRQGVFSRRSVNRARNLLFGSVKNPRVIRSSARPLFLGSILIDTSGSMKGKKLENARKLSVFYAELFSHISEEFGYIRFSLNTFSDAVTEIKAYDQDYTSPKRYDFPDGKRSTIKHRLMTALSATGGTNMLDGIKKAAADLNRETHDFPEYASALYVVGDGGDTCGNSEKVKDFLATNERERGFGDHMRSAIMLGSAQEKAALAQMFGEEHTTVAADLDALIEESMLRFSDDIETYLADKV